MPGVLAGAAGRAGRVLGQGLKGPAQDWTPRPRDFLPRVVTARALLSRRQHRDHLAAPNFRHDRSLPQPPEPNLLPGPAPIWPVGQRAQTAPCSPRVYRLALPKAHASEPTLLEGVGSVSRSALKARPSARIVEMSQPKVTYMVGLTVAMQHSLGGPFKERMRNRIVDTLGTSYAELALGPRASDMRQFYQQQDLQMPFEPFPVGPGHPGSGAEQGPLGMGSSASGVSCSRSKEQRSEQRLQWEAARSQPKRDFTVYQRVPERKRMPYKRLLPRLQVLSTPPQRYRVTPADRDPFKVTERAMRAVATERLERLARPRSQPQVRP